MSKVSEKVQVYLTEEQNNFITEFAESRCITKCAAVRLIIELKLKQEKELKEKQEKRDAKNLADLVHDWDEAIARSPMGYIN